MRLKSHQDPGPDSCFSRVKELYRQSLRCGQAGVPAGGKLSDSGSPPSPGSVSSGCCGRIPQVGG